MALENFFQPRSVAVVGVSRREKKLGNQILENLIRDGFGGEIFPINAKATPFTEILGMRAYPRLIDVPQDVDLAIIVVPSQYVPSIIEDCGAKGVDSAVIISAGFKEAGSEGARLEKEVIEKAKGSGIRILGPNVLGIIDTHHRLNASFAPVSSLPGSIAFFSQSGALGSVILDRAEGKGIGFSKFISLGNKGDLDEVDFLRVLKDDAKTKVILGYLESIERGRDFIKVAGEITDKKPFILIKSGKSKAGKRAAFSHTGSLSGQDEAYEAVFRETGIIRANSIGEALDLIQGFSYQPIPQGNRVLLLTNAGGVGIMATDACEISSLQLAGLEEITRERLRQELPSNSSITNPVDLLGDAKSDRYRIALEITLADPKVDGIIVLLTPQRGTEEEEIAKIMGKFSSPRRKTILSCFMGGDKVKKTIKLLQKSNIPNYQEPEAAIKVLEAMFRYGERLKRAGEEIKIFPVNKAKVKDILSKSKKEEYLELGGKVALEIMEAYGIPTVENYLVQEAKEAVKLAEKLSSTIAMKIESPAISHKSDIGGVMLDLEKKGIEKSFYNIMERAKKVVGEDKIRGILIQPMIKEGKEILIGASYNEVFGHLIKFGWGGKYVEIYKDVSTRLTPLTPGQAREMIEETRIISRLLKGMREEKPSDIALIEEALLRFSQLVTDFPQIMEVEANPLLVWERGGVVVDARLRII